MSVSGRKTQQPKAEQSLRQRAGKGGGRQQSVLSAQPAAVGVAPAGGNFRRATLRDVAALAGVSLMTVSRVVRGVGVVRSETVARVSDAIARTGYSADPILSALAEYRTPDGGRGTGQIAFIDCDSSAYSQHVLAGVCEQAQLFGYAVQVHKAGDSVQENRRLSRILYHRGVRGLLFGPSDSVRTFDGWDWSNFASVSLGALTHEPKLHAVAMDYFEGAFSGYQMLGKLGCRRIAHVVQPHFETRTGNRWLGGYSAAVACAGAGAVLRWDGSPWSGFPQWLRKYKVDGILTIHPEAEAAAAALPRASRVAFLNEFNMPDFPAYYYSIAPQQIGGEGLRMIHHLLLRNERGLCERPHVLALCGRWRQHSAVGCSAETVPDAVRNPARVT